MQYPSHHVWQSTCQVWYQTRLPVTWAQCMVGFTRIHQSCSFIILHHCRRWYWYHGHCNFVYLKHASFSQCNSAILHATCSIIVEDDDTIVVSNQVNTQSCYCAVRFFIFSRAGYIPTWPLLLSCTSCLPEELNQGTWLSEALRFKEFQLTYLSNWHLIRMIRDRIRNSIIKTLVTLNTWWSSAVSSCVMATHWVLLRPPENPAESWAVYRNSREHELYLAIFATFKVGSVVPVVIGLMNYSHARSAESSSLLLFGQCESYVT